jgi:D-alanyl-D-alanine carboxypeptidase
MTSSRLYVLLFSVGFYFVTAVPASLLAAEGQKSKDTTVHTPFNDEAFINRLVKTCEAIGLPKERQNRLVAFAKAEPEKVNRDISEALKDDPYLRFLVDKQHALASTYVPPDLVPLKDPAYVTSKKGLVLRRSAAESLKTMAQEARKQGVTLVVSSTYRSFAYQKGVYNRIVAELGKEAADRESAEAGHSQHQLGLAVDFGSIDDSFAQTRAGKWLTENASSFGWSLSYPRNLESVTGYRWESWHYRYVGPRVNRVIADYFGGIQQYALEFLFRWQKE